MGNAKGFVQIEMAHITAKFARCGHTHEGIHIGAVHIHAPTMLMHQCAERFYLRLEYTVRAGIGDHDCR